MSFFAKKQKSPHMALDDQETREAFTRMAQTAELDVLSRSDSLLEEMRAALDEDTRSYYFECLRFGDFLNVRIRRLQRDYRAKEARLQEITQSINLGKTDRISFNPGHAPDREGCVSYRAVFITVGTGDATIHKPDKATPVFPDARPNRLMVGSTGYRDAYCGSGSGSWCNFLTKNFPRVSADDEICFESPPVAVPAHSYSSYSAYPSQTNWTTAGTSTSIFVPFGQGERIYTIIMKEIGDRYAPPSSEAGRSR